VSFFYVHPSGPGYAGLRVRSGPLLIAEERDEQGTKSFLSFAQN